MVIDGPIPELDDLRLVACNQRAENRVGHLMVPALRPNVSQNCEPRLLLMLIKRFDIFLNISNRISLIP